MRKALPSTLFVEYHLVLLMSKVFCYKQDCGVFEDLHPYLINLSSNSNPHHSLSLSPGHCETLHVQANACRVP